MLKSRSLLTCLSLLWLLLTSCGHRSDGGTSRLAPAAVDSLPVPRIECDPRHYLCYRAARPPEIDGRLQESVWKQAAWTEAFVDIEGGGKPAPPLNTRAKMLWDSTYFYIAAEMQEPHVRGTLIEHDADVRRDNDFGVFIDPNGDTHEYFEIEVNALGTISDVLMVRPYRDGGPAVSAWDIRGLRSAVQVVGSLNDPTDVDSGWSVELAIPWDVLGECAHKDAPPRDGDRWRVNLSRVEWRHVIEEDRYVGALDPASGGPAAADNWVWSPQGLAAMHYPEMWGIVQFSRLAVGTDTATYLPQPDQAARWAMRRLYYAERTFYMEHERYSEQIDRLGLDSLHTAGYRWPPTVKTGFCQFMACLLDSSGTRELVINQEGRIWSRPAKR